MYKRRIIRCTKQLQFSFYYDIDNNIEYTCIIIYIVLVVVDYFFISMIASGMYSVPWYYCQDQRKAVYKGALKYWRMYSTHRRYCS